MKSLLNYLVPFDLLFTKSLIGIDTEFHTDLTENLAVVLTVTLTESHSECHSELFIKGFIEFFNGVLTELPSSMCFIVY